MMRIFPLLSALLFAACFTWPAAAQDPVEFNRLSSDQRQLAEQVRRLEKILLTLEQREEAEGNESKVELLRTAHLKLADVGDERPLATVLEEIASDLSELRAGTALEQQAELIAILQELLDYLLETEREEQVKSLLDEAKRREAELRALADAQAKLREQTEALEAKERASGETMDAERQALADAQAKLNQKMKEMAEPQDGEPGAEQAEEAAEAGEDAEEDLRGGSKADEPSDSAEKQDGEMSESEAGENGEPSESENGEPSEPENGEPSQPETGEQSKPEKGEQPSEPSESQPSEPSDSPPGEPSDQQSSEQPPSEPGTGQREGSSPRRSPEDLKDAQEHQKEAEEKLKQAAEQAKAEAEQLADMQELESLINVLEKAEELAERHRQVLVNIEELVGSMDGASRVPRSARVQLRQWAGLQKQIADEANDLLFEIREHGADTFPFLLRAIVEDHRSLSKRIGPPRYRANADSLTKAAGLANDWQRLIDAIRIEAERLRKKAESPPPPQGGDDQQQPPNEEPAPLVSFAAEVQLLKMIQSDLRDRIDSLRTRQEMLAKAGIAMDEDDLADLDQLTDRQKRLRSLFESILERLREEQDSEGGDI